MQPLFYSFETIDKAIGSAGKFRSHFTECDFRLTASRRRLCPASLVACGLPFNELAGSKLKSERYCRSTRNRVSLADSSRQNIGDHTSVILFETFVTGHIQAVGVEAKLMQQCCMDVGHIVWTLRRMEADLVGRTVCDPTLDSASCQPNAETMRVVVSSVGTL